MPYEYTCLNCGKHSVAYIKKHTVRLFCCHECQREYYKKLNIHVCKHCHKEFEAVGHPLFCSRECAAAYPSTGLEQSTCIGCGKLFVSAKSRYQKYCSRECFKETASNKKTCLVCGVVFKASNNKRKYCSNECRIFALSNRCPVCGHVVVNSSFTNGCCSYQCWREYQKRAIPSAELIAMLIKEYPIKRISEMFGVTRYTIYDWCRDSGVDIRRIQNGINKKYD